MINWISCADKMPDTVGDYLICYERFGYQLIGIAYIEDDEFVSSEDGGAVCVFNATHWSDLNKPSAPND